MFLLFILVVILIILIGFAVYAYIKKDPYLSSLLGIIATALGIIVAILIANKLLVVITDMGSDSQKTTVNDTAEESKAESYVDDNGYLHFNGHTYVLASLQGNYDQITYAFNYYYSGAYLAIISDADENEVIYDYLCSVTPENIDVVYFGLRYKEGLFSKSWRWVDGSQPNFTYWEEGQPDINNYKHYAVFNLDNDMGKWFSKTLAVGPDIEVPVLLEWDEDITGVLPKGE